MLVELVTELSYYLGRAECDDNNLRGKWNPNGSDPRNRHLAELRGPSFRLIDKSLRIEALLMQMNALRSTDDNT